MNLDALLLIAGQPLVPGDVEVLSVVAPRERGAALVDDVRDVEVDGVEAKLSGAFGADGEGVGDDPFGKLVVDIDGEGDVEVHRLDPQVGRVVLWRLGAREPR